MLNTGTYLFEIGTMSEDGTLDSTDGVNLGDVDVDTVLGCYLVLYDNDGNNPDLIIWESPSEILGVGGGPLWIRDDGGGESLSNGVTLWIGVQTENNGDITVPFDATGSNNGIQLSTTSHVYGTFPEPFAYTASGVNRVYGAYINYTASGGSTLLPNSMNTYLRQMGS